MSYNVTDDEKRQAERAILFFKHTSDKLKEASEYLNVMKTPFKDNTDIPSTEITNARAAIRRFRDKAIENFNEFKIYAFKCVNVMQSFASDTQTIKLMKSLIASIDKLEDQVNKFSDIFNDLESKDFVKNIASRALPTSGSFV